MLSLRKGAVAGVNIWVCFTRVQKYLKHKLHVNLFPEDHTIDHTIYDVFKSYLWPQSIYPDIILTVIGIFWCVVTHSYQ